MSRLYFFYLDFEIAVVGLVTEGQIEVHLGLEVRRGVQVHHWDQTRQNKVEKISDNIFYSMSYSVSGGRLWIFVLNCPSSCLILIQRAGVDFVWLRAFFLPFYSKFSTLSTLMDGIFQIKTEGAFPVNILSISPLSIYITVCLTW